MLWQWKCKYNYVNVNIKMFYYMKDFQNKLDTEDKVNNYSSL